MSASRSRFGALPYQMLQEMIAAGFILGAKDENIRPASLDLSISDEVYAVEGVFQPRHGETVRDLLGMVGPQKHELDQPLQKGKVYLARLNERFELPEGVYGYCNPKSTSGRLDLHVRVLADGITRYDAIPLPGWKGELWIAIQPKSFPVKLSSGQTLSQIRLFNGDTRMSELEIQMAMKQHKLLWRQKDEKPLEYGELKIRDNDGALILTLDLSGDVLGYRCVQPDMVVDLDKVGHYDPNDFFEPIAMRDGMAKLDRGEFYILSTREGVRVPPELSCEMSPMDERSGDFRSHYAGFIDPGWGWGKEGEDIGRPITLEVRPFEDLVVRHGQPVGKIRFERMIEVPHMLYDETNSNYIAQAGPRLAKHFKM